MNKKPKLAIVSSYEELCGNATYAFTLKNNLSVYFDVDVFGVRTNLPPRLGGLNGVIGTQSIKEISDKLKDYDIVNIQLEAGLYGDNSKVIIQRLSMLIDASKKVIITIHRLDLEESYRAILLSLKLLQIRRFVRTVYRKIFWNNLYQKCINLCQKKLRKDKAHFIVHTKREKFLLNQYFNVEQEKITDYPIAFLDKKDREYYKKWNGVDKWKKNLDIPKAAKIIGVFGFVSKYKGHDIVINTLRSLPDNYYLVISGGQHPASIADNMVDKYIADLLKMLEKKAYANLCNRIRFIGVQSDEGMLEAMTASDYVVLPYLEVGQSASGIASIALELGKKTILSRTGAFQELSRYYKDSFELFDIGNFLELRDKILYFDQMKLVNLNNSSDACNAEGLAKQYLDIFNSMS